MTMLWVSEYWCQLRPWVQQSSNLLVIPLPQCVLPSKQMAIGLFGEGLGNHMSTCCHLSSQWVSDLKSGSDLDTEQGIRTFYWGGTILSPLLLHFSLFFSLVVGVNRLPVYFVPSLISTSTTPYGWSPIGCHSFHILLVFLIMASWLLVLSATI